MRRLFGQDNCESGIILTLAAILYEAILFNLFIYFCLQTVIRAQAMVQSALHDCLVPDNVPALSCQLNRMQTEQKEKKKVFLPMSVLNELNE